jgi:hypothetical protein
MKKKTVWYAKSKFSKFSQVIRFFPCKGGVAIVAMRHFSQEPLPHTKCQKEAFWRSFGGLFNIFYGWIFELFGFYSVT